MSTPSAKLISTSAPEGVTPLGPRIGRIVAVRPPDVIQVDFPGNPHGPLTAVSTVAIDAAHCDGSVLLVFENSDFRRPVIVGLIREQPVTDHPKALTELNRGQIVDILVDGEKLVVDAKKEIEIRCGRSSLIMKPDGKVVLKGDDVTTRARRTNKVKGAAVRIN